MTATKNDVAFWAYLILANTSQAGWFQTTCIVVSAILFLVDFFE